MQQYPYILKALIHKEATRDEETGDWIPATSDWVEIGKCRDEINGSGRKVTTEDGETYEYSWMVYAPKNTRRLEKGTPIQVVDGCYVRAEKEVLRFSQDQLHCRIWL